VIIAIIDGHGVKGDGFLHKSLIAPSSESARGDSEYHKKTCKSTQSKNHARQSLVLKEGLVDGNNSLGGRRRGIDERNCGMNRTPGSSPINRGRCCRCGGSR